MKTKTIFKTMIALLMAISLNGCTKDGAVGPAGPQGQAGSNGTNGVSNISTTQFNIYNFDWVTLTANYSWDYIANVSAITDYNNDAVEVYFSTVAGGSWVNMPVSDWFVTGDHLTYQFKNGDVIIYYYLASSGSAPSSTLYFNVIVIPPAVMKRHPNTNWRNYSETESVMNAEKTNY